MPYNSGFGVGYGMPYGMFGNFNPNSQGTYQNIPELASQEDAASNRQRIAQMMFFQGQQPLQTSQDAYGSPTAVSPVAALGGIAQALAGAYGMRSANKAMQGLAGQRAKMVSDQMANSERIRLGTPAVAAVPAQMSQPTAQMDTFTGKPGMYPPTPLGEPVQTAPAIAAVPAVAPDVAKANEALVLSRMPELNALGNYRQKIADQITAREDAQAHARELAQQRAHEWALTRKDRREIADQANRTRYDLVRPIQVDIGGVPTWVNPITGHQLGLTPQAAIENSKLQAKRTFGTEGIGNSIQSARDLLTGVVRDSQGNPIEGMKGTLPTSSGLGSLVDTAGSWVGTSPQGADQAAALKAVGANLTMKMPRMEGPQGVADLNLYTQSAGMVGDSSLPLSQRTAALNIVEHLYQKYGSGSVTGTGTGGGMKKGQPNVNNLNMGITLGSETPGATEGWKMEIVK